MWAAVELDLFDMGIDYEDHALRAARTWRWARLRIFAAISTTGSRSNRLLTAPAPAEEPPATEHDDGDPEV